MNTLQLNVKYVAQHYLTINYYKNIQRSCKKVGGGRTRTLDVCNQNKYASLRNISKAGEPEPGVFGSFEPEPLEKKPGAGAGAAWKKSGARAAKKLAGSSALREDKRHLTAPQPCEKIKGIRKLYISYSSLGKIVSFYG